jgi:hypothetical protein
MLFAVEEDWKKMSNLFAFYMKYDHLKVDVGREYLKPFCQAGITIRVSTGDVTILEIEEFFWAGISKAVLPGQDYPQGFHW